jgi:CrcB protein
VPVRSGLLLTAVGGALGALLRWGLGTLLPTGDGFPWTTLAVNISGSALLAALPLLSLVHRRPWLPLLLGTGFLGGFTTMSTFSVETVTLADSGQPGLAAGYVAATLVGSVAAVALVDRWTSAPARVEVDLLEGDE